MYLPASFRSDDHALALRVIREHIFATVITCPEGQIEVSHVPVVHEDGKLRFHIARANPHRVSLSAGASVLAVFHGPHAYVSPTWYGDPMSVPTWNYVVVHAHGRARELSETELRALVDQLTRIFEAASQPETIDKLIGGIAGYEVAIDRLETKLKLSQNRSAEDQRRVADALAASADGVARDVAVWMQRAAASKSAVALRGAYDTIARSYADHFASELEHKLFDRRWLDELAERTRRRGVVADLGCGPGHVAAYLAARGVRTLGIDLSSSMIEEARRLFPALDFRAGDMRNLDLPDRSLAGVVAAYAIVHLDDSGLAEVFAELRRVLEPGGLLYLSFHVGAEHKHVDELLGHEVSMDFRFFETEVVSRFLSEAGFVIEEVAVRPPYEGVEYPSTRAYVRASSP